jgi:DNA-binding LacI/PurR family transcriptional regulator
VVADAHRERIRSGSLAGGAKLPALRELAEEFGVSTMAIRQAIQRLEREGHVYRMRGVGAFVRPAAPAAQTGRNTLVFAATDLNSAFEVGIARGVERACRQRGWAVQILDAYHDAGLEAQNMLDIPGSGCRGAIVVPTWGDDRCVESLFRLQASGLPLVVADRIPPGLSADFVESNHEKGAFKAVRHLLQHGHPRVWMLTPPPLVSSIAARIYGYERALRAAGISPRPEWKVWLNLDVQAEAFRAQKKWLGGYNAILPLLREQAPPVAVFAVDPYTAWGVYEACRELGLRIPQEVSIVGFDDSEISLAMKPPITIIAQRTEEIGRAAVEMLVQLVESAPALPSGRRNYQHVVIDVDLVERESVARASAADRPADPQ